MTDTPTIRDILEITTCEDCSSEVLRDTEQAINAYILGEVMELIGTDEEPLDLDHYDTRHNFMFLENLKSVRNQLRQELRNKANKKFGVQK